MLDRVRVLFGRGQRKGLQLCDDSCGLIAQLFGCGQPLPPFFPGREPAANVASTGNGGEIVKVLEDAKLGQPLQGSQCECGAADAAAGDAQRAALLSTQHGVLLGQHLFKTKRSFRAVRSGHCLRKRLWREGFLVWHAENIYSSVHKVKGLMQTDVQSHDILCTLLSRWLYTSALRFGISSWDFVFRITRCPYFRGPLLTSLRSSARPTRHLS